MKAILILSILFGLFFSCKRGPLSLPEESPSWLKLKMPFSLSSIDIQFINPDTGYIIGQTTDNITLTNHLLKTKDGGQTWFQTNLPNQVGALSIYPYNLNILFANGPKMIRSIDGGIHWYQIIPTNGNDPHMFFLDPSHAITLGIGRIFSSADSGLTWEETYSPIMNTTFLQFPDSRIGYAVDYNNFNGPNGVYFLPMIIKTLDGGKTWNEVAYLNYPLNDILAMDFINDSVGYVIKTYGIGGNLSPEDAELLKTQDGGKTWAMVNSMLPVPAFAVVLHFFTGTEGVF